MVGTREINNVLARINSKRACARQNLLHLRSGYGKYGVDLADDRNLSPLLSRTALYRWLLAFEEGADSAHHPQGDPHGHQGTGIDSQ